MNTELSHWFTSIPPLFTEQSQIDINYWLMGIDRNSIVYKVICSICCNWKKCISTKMFNLAWVMSSVLVALLLTLWVLKQRWWPEDHGLVGRQSSPAVTNAASQTGSSATFSMTVATADRMNKTVRRVSEALVDPSKHTKESKKIKSMKLSSVC